MNAQTVGWLIFLALIKNFSCEQGIPFHLEPNLEAKEGSCVEIVCKIKNKPLAGNDPYWFWMKNAIYNDSIKAYQGTVIYSTDISKRPVSPDYTDRVRYIGSPTSEWISVSDSVPKWCSILICDLNKTDSGNYSLRYIGRYNKWFTKQEANLTVDENPCLIDFEKPTVVMENQSVTLKCSTSSLCPSNPQIEGLTVFAEPIREAQQKGITINFTPTWKDNGKEFSCQTQNNKDKYMVRNISLIVEYAPKDTRDKMSSINVTEGQSVLLNCSMIGNPEPTYTWYIKNQTQAVEQSYMLTITSVKDSQSGEYHCEARNKHGNKKSNPVFINVLYAPDVKIVMTSSESSIHTIRQGCKMTLTCNVMRSNPPPNRYTWLKDNSHIGFGETYKVQRIEPKNRGTYICEAENTVGTGKSQPFKIEVEYRPRWTHISDSDHIDVKVGHSLTLTCQTDANPAPIKYSWYRYSRNKQINASQWTSQTSSEKSLPLKEVQRGDDLCYTCNATNKIGTGDDSLPLCIRVLYPPTNIKLYLLDTEVREGQLITISCTVESFPLSYLTLTKTSILSAQPPKGIIISERQNNILTHKFTANSTHAGFYTCSAKNTEGSEKSPQRKLVVKHTPQNVFIHAEPDLIVNENKSLNLSCRSQSHPQVTSFTWMKMIDRKEALMNATQSLIALKSVTPSDSGQYSCTASNEIGSGKSQLVEVKVKYAPKHIDITKVAEKQLSDGKRSVTLSCSTHCYPAAKYVWYKKMDDQSEDVEMFSHQNLTVNSDHPGIYYCIAENEMGKRWSDPYELFRDGVLTKILIFTFVSLFIIFTIGFIYRCRRDKSHQQGTLHRLPWWTCFSFLACENSNRGILVEPSRSRDDLLPGQPRQPRPDTTAASRISNIYSAVNLPRRQGPSAQMPDRNEGGHAESDTLNYVFLDFGNQQTQQTMEQDTCALYAMVSKTKPSQKNDRETMEPYENIENVHRPAHTTKSSDPLKYDSDTSEDDSDTSEDDSETSDDELELNYSKVIFTPKPGHQRDSTDSSTSDEEYTTQYSDVKI